MKKLISIALLVLLVMTAAIIPVEALETQPWFHIVDRVAVDNGDLRVMVDSGVVITISGAVTVTTSKGQDVDHSQIQEGSKLLVWYPAMVSEYPQQAVAERVVLLNFGAH